MKLSIEMLRFSLFTLSFHMLFSVFRLIDIGLFVETVPFVGNTVPFQIDSKTDTKYCFYFRSQIKLGHKSSFQVFFDEIKLINHFHSTKEYFHKIIPLLYSSNGLLCAVFFAFIPVWSWLLLIQSNCQMNLANSWREYSFILYLYADVHTHMHACEIINSEYSLSHSHAVINTIYIYLISQSDASNFISCAYVKWRKEKKKNIIYWIIFTFTLKPNFTTGEKRIQFQNYFTIFNSLLLKRSVGVFISSSCGIKYFIREFKTIRKKILISKSFIWFCWFFFFAVRMCACNSVIIWQTRWTNNCEK